MGWRLPACRLLRRILEPFGRVRGGKNLQAAHRRNWTACRCTAGSISERITARPGAQRAIPSVLARRRGSLVADERLRLARTRAAAPHVEGAAGDGACVPHEPVLLAEILEAFSTVGVGVFVDGTVGAGGHSSAVRRAHPEVRYHVGIDQDPAALALAAQALQPLYPTHRAFQLQDGKLRPAAPTSLGQAGAGDAGQEAGGGQEGGEAQLLLCRSNFRQVRQVLGSLNVPGRNGGLAGLVDGMLLDLGMSSMQVDTAERGFSFQQDGPIDMRMDPDAALSAEDVVNTWSEAELGCILRDFGEERMWRKVAQRIVAARAAQPIRSTAQLVQAIGRTSPLRKGGQKGKGVHPATRTFQALRIAVNRELAVLEQVLPDAVDCLAPRGKLAVISFHRLEDRIVKSAFLTAAGRAPLEPVQGKNVGRRMQMLIAEAQEQKALQERKATVLTKRPLVASEQEVAANPRSRSARLRILQRI